ncbi:hypothetical protein MT390_08460 [Vibrio sp. 2-Bac 85]
MLIGSQNKVYDLALGPLCEFLQIIDLKLSEISDCISKSIDPESDGLFDRGEYFIGIGFVAIQQHLSESLIGISPDKKEAYALGTTHSSGVSSIWIINAAANWWKHETEWFKNKKIPKSGEWTVEIIMDISNQYEYALSTVLASFSESKELSFINNIIPHVQNWTKEIYSKK